MRQADNIDMRQPDAIVRNIIELSLTYHTRLFFTKTISKKRGIWNQILSEEAVERLESIRQN